MFIRQRNKKFFLSTNKHLLALPILFFAFHTYAQKIDTLTNVQVNAIKTTNTSTALVPFQELSKRNLSNLSSLSVAEATQQLAGVMVKDYGGIGGLKTISVRSLGANHTGVMYNGIVLNDVQSGQIDLGKFSLDNIESIGLYNAQPLEILLPARSFSFASMLQLQTIIPVYNPVKKLNAKLAMRAGSFQYLAPALKLNYHFSKRFYNSISTEYVYSKGNYPFKSYENNAVTTRRKNANIKSYRWEYDAGYQFNDSNIIQLKTYYYHSDRGLPGAVILFTDNNNQQLEDKNAFVQASWKNKFSAKNSFLLNAKFSQNNNFYIDNDVLNVQGKLENDFHQQEMYFSAAFKHVVNAGLNFAIASDYILASLLRKDSFQVEPFPNPIRKSWMNNFSLNGKRGKFNFQANILQQYIIDERDNAAAKNKHVFTPTISVNFQPKKELPFYLRAFYKNIFRLPTFNELYYTRIGNTNLKPEYVDQYNVGITYRHAKTGWLQTAQFSVDGYYSMVKDKILAVPKLNLFQWTMLNIGKVKTKGVDVAMDFQFQEFNNVRLYSRLTYGYQRALDYTDRQSELYKSQLPYTPEHSASFNIQAAIKQFDIGYNLLLSSLRYRLGSPIPDNLVEGWATQDLQLSYQFTNNNYQKYKLTLSVNNILNTQYEVIKYYPMPKLNYRISIIANL